MTNAAALQGDAVAAATRSYEYARKLEVEVEKLAGALNELLADIAHGNPLDPAIYRAHVALGQV